MKKVLFMAVFFLMLTALLRSPVSVMAAPPPTCTWTGGSSSSWDWTDSQNWSCSDSSPRVPTANDNVVIAGGARVPHLDSDGYALNLTLSSTLVIGSSATLHTTTWTTQNGAVIDNGTGTVAGAGEISPGTTQACGRFSGNIIVDPAATLTVMGAPCSYIYASGNITVQTLGTINAADVDGAIYMLGNLVTNTGTISVPDFSFEEGSAATQHIAGNGSWSGTHIDIAKNTNLAVDNDMTFNSHLFSLGVGLEADSLQIGAHSVTFSGGTLSVGSNGTVAGTGTIHTTGGAEIDNDNVFNPNLAVDSNKTIAWGTFSGPITVASGATLSVQQAPAGVLTATNDVTINGTLDGEDPACTFQMQGAHFVNNGSVRIGNFSFYQPTVRQHLSGSGTWLSPTWLSVENTDTGQELDLQSTLNFQGYHMTLGNLNLGTNTFNMTGPSTLDFTSNGQITGLGPMNINGNITINANYAQAFTPNVTVSTGTTILAGGSFSGDFTIMPGASLNIPADGDVSLGGDLNVRGTMTSLGSLTLNGSLRQAAIGSGTFSLHDLDIENAAGFTLGLPASMDGALNLNGDIDANGWLTMSNTVTTTGTGDVFGGVIRTGPFTLDTAYSFGNPDQGITFTSGANLPSNVHIITYHNGKPLGLINSIKRWYNLSATSGSGYIYTLRLHYRDSEMNGIVENTLSLFSRIPPGSGTWGVNSSATFDPIWNTFEVTGLSDWRDWGIAGKLGIFLPMVKR